MDLSAFQAQPELASSLRTREWMRIFGPQTLDRARGYLSPDRLLESEVIRTKNSVVVYVVFRGNHGIDYDTSVSFQKQHRRGWSLAGDCDCPVGHTCKHVAAVLLAITSGLEGLPPGSSPDQSDFELDQWLTRVNQSASAPRPIPPPEKEYANFLAYCLKPPTFHYDRRFTLALHVGRFLKSGALRINDKSHAKADPVKPAKYMAPEDLLPATLHSQIVRQSYHYAGAKLSGPQGSILLQKALETGRLYYLPDRDQPQLILPGDPVTPEPVWQTASDGTATPGFALPLSQVLALIEGDPPFALLPHSEGGQLTLHELKTDKHSFDFLEAWQSGPTLRPGQLAKAAKRLKKESPSLPAPVAPKAKTLAPSKPAIRLHLHRANPFSHGGHHLSGKPKPVIGTLAFEYHGHEFRPDLSVEPAGKATFSAATKDTVFTIPRDTAFEREVTLHLVREHRFVPAGVIDDQIAPDHRSAFLPMTPPGEWDAAAAEFLHQSVPLLRDEGWQITVAEEARFDVHEIDPEQLETGLDEDPDQGIDWFRFSASYLTPEGEKQSLLPLLSNFLKTLDFEALGDSFEEQLRDLGEDHKTLLKDPADPQTFLAFPTTRLLRLAKTLHDLFGDHSPEDPLHRLQAATLADELEMDSSQTLKDLAALGHRLHNLKELPQPKVPKALQGTLRDYQLEGFHWMQFLARHSLHGILADDMGLGKTIQTLTHLQAEVSGRRTQKTPSLVIAPTSVVGNWQAEAKKFTPKLKTLLLHGPDRHDDFPRIPQVHLVITSYALLVRDFDQLKEHDFHLIVLDEAQYIKNPVAKVSQRVCKLRARHRLSLSGTPLENHLGELWSQMRFLMPGLLGSSETFRKKFRTPIEKHQDTTARLTLSSRVAPLILRRTKDAVATELPPKTEIRHTIPLNKEQVDLYETVRAAMDERIRDAIADKGLAKSQIVVLDALLKLRQICCHPRLLKIPAAREIKASAKLDFLTADLLPTLLEEGRKILIFSTFTTMLSLIEEHLKKKKVPFSKITGATTKRQAEIDRFQKGDHPVFLISLKAGGTGLNLTAADTVIHYDPWWNPAAENQATDRAYRIGQDKPVFVHKLISEGTIEERIVQLQSQKAKLVEALLSEETSKLQLDQETLGNLLAPLE